MSVRTLHAGGKNAKHEEGLPVCGGCEFGESSTILQLDDAT